MGALRLLASSSLFCVLAAALVAPGASAFNLTGTWEGRWTCQGFDGEKFRSGNPESIVRITHTGNTLAVNMDDGDYLYNGGSIDATSSPETKGEVVLTQCGTDNLPLAGAYGEILRAKAKADAEKGSGSLKGISVFESSLPDVFTCKYSYKRTSIADPAVAACP